MSYRNILVILFISIVLITVLACNGDSGTETPTVTASDPSVTTYPIPSSIPLPTLSPASPKPPTLCETQTIAIQEAVNAYRDEHDKWPTFDGRPGDIQWDKLVPNLLANEPSTDYQCDWQVDDDPEGIVCLPPENYC